MKKEINALKRAIKNQEKAEQKLHTALEDVIKFEFTIEDNSDGLCILNLSNDSLSPLNKCVKHINKYGFLDKTEHDLYGV